MKTRGKILVIRGGAIGDFILTLPVFAALRVQFPETHLEVLGYPRVTELALAGGLVDAARSIESRALAMFFAESAPLDREMAAYFAGFNIVVSFLYDPDEHFQENVRRISPAQFIAGPHRPDETQPLHATEVFLKPLERLAIFGADAEPRLLLASTNGHAPAAGRWIAAHPGSGSEKKNWPEWRWKEFLAALLAREPVNVLLVGGEAEAGRCQRLASALPAARVAVAENRPLAELARKLLHCEAFVGHDSGVTHLAAALGLPGLVLWGDTAEQVWRPRSGRFSLVRDPGGLSGLRVEEVLARLHEMLNTGGGSK